MNRSSRFAPRWSLFAGLFVLTFSLMIQHIVNGQGDDEEGFRFRLSEGRKKAPPSPTPTIAAPPSSTLPDDATRNLLNRLPPIAGAAGDKKEFTLRERSLPPPRAGRVSDESFPPTPISGAIVDSAAGSLDVLRFAPEGEVELAPHLSVTFSQPMVAVTSSVRLTMVAPSRRYHVALVDPLPAGFETLNPDLAITGHIPRDTNDQTQDNRRRYWWRQWFEHQNMRDERVETFTSLLLEGVYNYSYVARATTPGVFVVPPSKAEEMYHPETFGRGATDRVVVE